MLTTQELQSSFDIAETEQEASAAITTLAQWTHLNKGKVIFNEYYRLASYLPLRERKNIERTATKARESIPVSLRTILRNIYKGHCQICDFWFLKKDKDPYFEIHHLDSSKGHHPKNVLVVCGNCHNQFEHANVEQEFTEDLWLVKVSFNKIMHIVKQAFFYQKDRRFFQRTIYITSIYILSYRGKSALLTKKTF